MSASERAALIGKQAQWAVPGYPTLTVPVTIHDVREVYGRIDYRVTIDGGTGEAWIDAARVRLA